MNIARMEDRLKHKYFEANRLLGMQLDVIYRCDLDCCHCYLDDKRSDLLSTEELIDIMRQGREVGAMKITLSGGELFLRRDLFELIRAAREMRYYLRLKTHGGHISPEKARKLKELGVGQVDISVYALKDSVHDYITKRRGSLKRTMSGIENLHQAGVKVQVSCVVMTPNLEHYKAVYQHFTDMGIDCLMDASIRGNNSMELTPYDLGVTVEQKIEYERFKREQSDTPPKAGKNSGDDHICWAGKSNLYVKPDGTVTPCVAWPMPVGDLKQNTLAEVWENSPLLDQVKRSRRKHRGSCTSCTFVDRCQFCPGKAYIENNGEWLTNFSLQCSDTRAREFAALSVNAERVRSESPGSKRLSVIAASRPAETLVRQPAVDETTPATP